MRWMAMVVGVTVLAGAGMRMEAQAAGSAKTSSTKVSAAKPAPMMVTTASPTPAKDKPVLPEAFAGWVASRDAQGCDGCSGTGQRQCRGAEGVRQHGRDDRQL